MKTNRKTDGENSFPAALVSVRLLPEHRKGTALTQAVDIAARRADSLRSWRITGGGILPVTATIRVAGAARAMVIRTSEQLYGTNILPECLHGSGRRDGLHSHAFWLPEDRDSDGLLDHLSVFAPGGFCAGARELLAASTRLEVDGAGSFPLLPDSGATGVTGVTALRGPCRAWLPATPFIAPRHGWKKSPARPDPRRSARAQLAQELSRLRTAGGQMLPVADIHPVTAPHLPPATRFRLGSRQGKAPAGALRGWFAIEFAEPVTGPLCLGFAAHFGLGRFRPFHAGGAGG